MLPYIAAPWILWVLVWSPGSHIFLKSLGCHWKPGRRPHVTWGDQCQRQGRRCLTNQRWESMHQKRGYQLISMDIISIINININYQFSIINYKFPISISLSISISIINININYQYHLTISNLWSGGSGPALRVSIVPRASENWSKPIEGAMIYHDIWSQDAPHMDVF